MSYAICNSIKLKSELPHSGDVFDLTVCASDSVSNTFGRQKSIECRQPNYDLRFAQKPLHQVGLAQKLLVLEALGRGREDHVIAEAARLAEKLRQLTKGFEQVRKSTPKRIDKCYLCCCFKCRKLSNYLLNIGCLLNFSRLNLI